MATKLSIIKIKNKLTDPEKPEGTVYKEINALVDKFYPEFSGHELDHCFSNLVLNKHHKKQNSEDLMKDLDFKDFHSLLFESQRSKEILSIN